MTRAQENFLAMARTAEQLLHRPEVTAAWHLPSALPEFSIGGLAGHLAFQVLCVPTALAGPPPVEETVPLLGHYQRAKWVGAPLDADINVQLREGGEHLAAVGPEALAGQVAAALAELTDALAKEDGSRPVRLSFWPPYTLTIDDLLVTRTMELAVHSDDLAVSAGIPTPDLPPEAAESVLDLLTRIATWRHGPLNVLRALSRAERAPESIAAI
ncbi:maleylpyruvate isomerase N-terminal domain-containing protein [Streptomyces sp. NRRL WC-3742]|uniref:maleylpyruvate isomerase N-terminal domain-containing protein n=1 Tax=Streptomyces sp. NRRL WC-3742 TaxID=1463934 RepID=UPI0004C8FA02|nr:maleylpyruvate isomerase N-terminal domain-containing protein [Streptomyces sp. NRRL WC-3742]